ncbi:E3 ubiquitin-protein ligase TRIM21 [Amia ocellicauda]|uniref:E3 ubiquitin-protein ligase TRIM21 n=1 Tax=Amia ocellicauda TaxID=2972642 RepID=UPI0034647C90
MFYSRVVLSGFLEVPEGDDVVLPCKTHPERSVAALEVRWFRQTHNDLVCQYNNGKDTEGPDHQGRVKLFHQELERGNVSLQLSNTRLSDTGVYTCQINSKRKTILESHVKLEIKSYFLKRCQSRVTVTLDMKSINPYLIVSQNGRAVRWTEEKQKLPDTPERFDEYPCVLGVLGNKTVTSRGCYWEVKVGSKRSWELGVARASVCRKGQLTLSPETGFWVLSLWDGRRLKALTDPETTLDSNTIPSRVGVYLDYEKMQVSFYNAEAVSLIYSFKGED